jgi:hypothetical protein
VLCYVSLQCCGVEPEAEAVPYLQNYVKKGLEFEVIVT